jgi:hypothetical protein
VNGPRAGIGGMSGAGLLVVGTYCLGTLIALGTLCALAFLERDVPDQLDTLATTMVAGVGLLLAKTWADRPGPEQPEDEPQAPRSRRKRIQPRRQRTVPDDVT